MISASVPRDVCLVLLKEVNKINHIKNGGRIRIAMSTNHLGRILKRLPYYRRVLGTNSSRVQHFVAK